MIYAIQCLNNVCIFFDWLSVNDVVSSAVCCRLHWTSVKAGTMGSVCLLIGHAYCCSLTGKAIVEENLKIGFLAADHELGGGNLWC